MILDANSYINHALTNHSQAYSKKISIMHRMAQSEVRDGIWVLLFLQPVRSGECRKHCNLVSRRCSWYWSVEVCVRLTLFITIDSNTFNSKTKLFLAVSQVASHRHVMQWKLFKSIRTFEEDAATAKASSVGLPCMVTCPITCVITCCTLMLA